MKPPTLCNIVITRIALFTSLDCENLCFSIMNEHFSYGNDFFSSLCENCKDLLWRDNRILAVPLTVPSKSPKDVIIS